jgi:hypothetical protein
MSRHPQVDPALTVPDPPPPIGVRPPRNLSAPARRLFEDLVASVDHEHFVPSDAPLLAQYVEAIVLAERSAAELERSPGDHKALVLWEKATRVMHALSMRLRLSPQARREKARAEPRRLDWSTRYGLEHRDG